MDKQELLKKITEKKEFSQLPLKDVELAFSKFDNERYSDEEKVKLTRKFLREVFSSFTSQKLLNPRNKDAEWFLKKHISTRERLSYYKEIYERIFKNVKEKEISVIDLGCGVNALSFKFFPSKRSYYLGIEAVGQLVKLQNNYFRENKISGKVVHESLFNLDKIKELIKKEKTPRIIFLFKVIDSLEMIEKDYSKKLLLEIAPLTDRLVLSYATRSFVKRERFKANRSWILNFIQENFNLIDDFEINGERYLIVEKKI